MRLFPKKVAYDLLHFRNSRAAADKHDLVNIARLDACVRQSLLAGSDRTLEDIIHQRFKLGSR